MREKTKWYEVIKQFECCEKQMVIVRIGNNVHVMDEDEWKKVYGRNHPERWEQKR